MGACELMLRRRGIFGSRTGCLGVLLRVLAVCAARHELLLIMLCWGALLFVLL